MKPRREDVEQMVGTLMTVLRSMNRASRKGDASRLMALFAIGMRSGSTPKAISEELDLHPSSITRQIQALEEEGHVKVTANPQDGRSCRVSLTASGRAEIERLQEIGMQRFASFVAKWDAEEVRMLTRLLAKLEQSKAEVNAMAKPSGPRWQQKERVK
jgi:DNA-binding MarR family transcriptional regulator